MSLLSDFCTSGTGSFRDYFYKKFLVAVTLKHDFLYFLTHTLNVRICEGVLDKQNHYIQLS